MCLNTHTYEILRNSSVIKGCTFSKWYHEIFIVIQPWVRRRMVHKETIREEHIVI